MGFSTNSLEELHRKLSTHLEKEKYMHYSRNPSLNSIFINLRVRVFAATPATPPPIRELLASVGTEPEVKQWETKFKKYTLAKQKKKFKCTAYIRNLSYI